MRKIIYTIAILLASFHIHAQTLFSYGPHSVSKKEFMDAFEKNNPVYENRQKALDEYLDLYIRYKLKVRAAYDQKLDTLSGLKDEVNSFRDQILPMYLTDQHAVDSLAREAYIRSAKDIHLGHIYIPFANSKDSLQAAKDILDAMEDLKQGKPFSQVAGKWSKDPSVKVNQGDLGYMTVFSLPYKMENIVYSLPIGQYSHPYQSTNAFHIFCKYDERPAAGRVTLSQILLAVPPGAGESEWTHVSRQADSLYAALLKGGSFEALARNFSMDESSAVNGGLMPEFGVGTYDPAFEKQAFALQQDGDIGKPFRSDFGMHILKRIHAAAVTGDTMLIHALYKPAVIRDGRGALPRQWFEEQVMKKVKITPTPFDSASMWKLTDTFAIHNKILSGLKSSDQTIVMKFPESQLRASEWLRYAKVSGNVYTKGKGVDWQPVFENFRRQATVGYYRDHLEEYDPAFAEQIREFKDGSLLFEAMERNVWSTSQSDSNGMKKFYESRKQNYYWAPSAEVLLFSAEDSLTAVEIQNNVSKYIADWKNVGGITNNKALADSTRWELEALGLPADPVPAAPSFTPIRVNSTDGTASFAYILKVYPQKSPRTYEEAKGLVLNDYQVVMEEKWVQQLKTKYPVKVDQKVWQNIRTH